MANIIHSWRFEKDHVHPYAWQESLFTPEECEKIIEVGNQHIKEEANVGQHQGRNDKKIRDSKISWISPTPHTDWFFNKCVASILELNSKYFHFELTGLFEGLQFTRYEAPSGKYDKHVDRTFNSLIRKLSFTVQLSDPKKEKGGFLNIYDGDVPNKTKKSQGLLIAFPSFMLHEVTKVTKGTRYSLVGWVGGPNFK